METNIALGRFVNSTQLLFRVMGAPPCHNNSLKEEQFNVNNIFSICLFMKSHRSTWEMLPHGQGGADFAKSSPDYINAGKTPMLHSVQFNNRVNSSLDINASIYSFNTSITYANAMQIESEGKALSTTA